ncbi:uncharacterized protein LOC123643736 isoform X1 [Lemur catta]|uniref:uncharacterized protein LOC123643736 isoform X1 n=1 Tax=Lemur catta TaxID=9447 RepID=UPI001E268D84|nr:uncharacterized protein LOC123643736 isoform X1 [Lemur catta]
MSFYSSYIVLNKTFPRLGSKRHLWLPEWTGTVQIIWRRKKGEKRKEIERDCERKRRSYSWEKLAIKELNPPEIPAHGHPFSLQTHIPTQNEKIRKRGWGTSTPKRDKKREKGRKKPTCEVLFVVLARNGEKKKHEEAAKCGGEKGGSEETAPGANCTKTSPRVSGGRTVIPAEQEREERP